MKKFVTAEPFTSSVELNCDGHRDDFLIFACDGVWDVLRFVPSKLYRCCHMSAFHAVMRRRWAWWPQRPRRPTYVPENESIVFQWCDVALDDRGKKQLGSLWKKPLAEEGEDFSHIFVPLTRNVC